MIEQQTQRGMLMDIGEAAGMISVLVAEHDAYFLAGGGGVECIAEPG
jgi:hypothetical protein